MVRKEKLRNCVRREAFRYFCQDAVSANLFWKVFISTFGEDKRKCPFPIREINHEKFQARLVEDDLFITIIWLAEIDSALEQKINAIFSESKEAEQERQIG